MVRESFFYPKYLKHAFHCAISYKITCASFDRQQWCALFTRRDYTIFLGKLLCKNMGV